jgi:hypothetical protein
MVRFFSKVAVDPGGCHVWTASKETRKGYGKFSNAGRTRKAHRVAWEIAKGEVPVGMMVCHRCDNPSCVNVGHLFLGTNADNLKDMAAKGRSLIGEANRNAKLTEDDVREIIASSDRTCDLAKRFGISPQHMGAIRNGAAWKHLKVAV